MSTTVPTSGPARRDRRRQATLAEIVAVSRELLTDPGGLSLRAVAQRMGITAPALYRYVASYRELVELVADAIDADTARLLEAARDSQPEDDPAAQIVCAAIAFRRWALSHREEFGLVFTNPITAHSGRDPEDIHEERTGAVFTRLLFRLWETYRFAIPAPEDLDPAVAATLDDPVMPGKLDEIPPEARGLLWVFTQAWMALYGTVTLEVYGHCDPRIIDSGALFRSMLASQAELLGLVEDLPRLQPMIEQELAR